MQGFRSAIARRWLALVLCLSSLPALVGDLGGASREHRAPTIEAESCPAPEPTDPPKAWPASEQPVFALDPKTALADPRAREGRAPDEALEVCRSGYATRIDRPPQAPA